jgi:hypothetical protein
MLLVLVLIVANLGFWSSYLRAFSWSLVVSALVRPTAVAWAAWAKDMSKDPGRLSVNVSLDACMAYPQLSLAVVLLVLLLPLEVALIAVPSAALALPLGLRVLVRSGLAKRVLQFLAPSGHMSAVILWCTFVLTAWICCSMAVASLVELAELLLAASRVVSSYLGQADAAAAQWQDSLHKHLDHTGWAPAVRAVVESMRAQESSEDMVRRVSDAVKAQFNGTEWAWFTDRALHALATRSSSEVPPVGEVLSRLGKLPSNVFAATAGLVWSGSRLAALALAHIGNFAGQAFASAFLLQKLCGMRRDAFDLVCGLGLRGADRDQLADRLRAALAQVLLPTFSATRSALIVLVVYTLLARKCAFIAAELVFVLGLTSLVRTKDALLLVSAPWAVVPALRLVLAEQPPSLGDAADALAGLALPLFLLRALALAAQRSPLPAQTHIVSPWLMDFSVGVGMSHFGFDGLLLGPSLVAVTVVLCEFVFEEAEPPAAGAEPRAAAELDASPPATPLRHPPPLLRAASQLLTPARARSTPASTWLAAEPRPATTPRAAPTPVAAESLAQTPASKRVVL